MTKLVSIVVFCLISLSVFAKEIDKDRYKDYQFDPQYNANDEQLREEARNLVNQYLLEKYPTGWRNVSKIYGAGLWGNRLIVSYSIGNTKGKVLEREAYMRDCDAYYKEHGKKKPECIFKSKVISVFKDGVYETDLVKKRGQLIPNGHYGFDFYGCIDLKPIFTAPMIEDQGSALLTVTGNGNRDPVMRDRLTLSIYDESLNNSVKEDLMLINMVWAKRTKPTKYNRLYNFSAAGEMPQGHILDIPDNRARKKYAKMYVSDFNEDGLLELLFWHRQYYSTLIDDKERL
ncbi:MAG: hypothetical protein GY912_05240, partial [Candidatus Marinimicrobia bacterium]|nr:hypothetical protein [Candidatus Neomarinimicrobiota bacterium]